MGSSLHCIYAALEPQAHGECPQTPGCQWDRGPDPSLLRKILRHREFKHLVLYQSENPGVIKLILCDLFLLNYYKMHGFAKESFIFL